MLTNNKEAIALVLPGRTCSTLMDLPCSGRPICPRWKPLFTISDVTSTTSREGLRRGVGGGKKTWDQQNTLTKGDLHTELTHRLAVWPQCMVDTSSHSDQESEKELYSRKTEWWQKPRTQSVIGESSSQHSNSRELNTTTRAATQARCYNNWDSGCNDPSAQQQFRTVLLL